MSVVVLVQYPTISTSSKDGLVGIVKEQKIPESEEMRHTIVRKRRREIA